MQALHQQSDLANTTGCSNDPPTMGCPPLSASKIIIAANESATRFQRSDGGEVDGGRPRAKNFYHGHDLFSRFYRYGHCRTKVPDGCNQRMNSWIALRVFTQYDFSSFNTLPCESRIGWKSRTHGKRAGETHRAEHARQVAYCNDCSARGYCDANLFKIAQKLCPELSSLPPTV